MIVLQLIVYCLLFTVMVRYAVRGGAIDGLYFYPKAVQDRAIEIGLTRLWNHVSDFKTAYMQALLFLEVMNWYDGIFIDKVWVGTSRFWILPGCEDIPYVQTWPQVLKKRGMLTLIWIAGAAIAAGIVVLFAR